MSSVIYVQNNTPFSFNVSWKREGAALSADRWKAGSSRVLPGRRSQVLEFNRDAGITSGKRFYFTSSLTRGDGALQLRQQLLGQTVGSTMWQSLAGPGFKHEWHDDRRTRSARWPTVGVSLDVKYRAYFTGGDDDIEYILQHNYDVEPSDEHTLNILAYNIYMRPFPMFVNGQLHRTAQLPAQLSGYDVIVFSEAFDDPLRKLLLTALKAEYPHVSRILGWDSGAEQDGGVIIASRWPIADQAQLRFGSVCSGSDCLSDKGVLYVKIMKGHRPYHVFGSHMQADNGADDIVTRRKQLKLMKSFIDSRKIPASEPVIIAGDLNVDKARSAEYRAMLEILDADDPPTRGMKYTYYPLINTLASSGGGEFLDYVLWSKKHLRPRSAQNEVRLLRARNEWKDLPTEKARWELSDHFPIYGRLTFPVPVVKRVDAATPRIPVKRLAPRG